jgi:hypothetical protein
MSLDKHPHPVLVQDLTRAQSSLMTADVASFVDQAGKTNFWEKDALGSFELNLRNLLETASTGLGLSKEAVKSWINYFE